VNVLEEWSMPSVVEAPLEMVEAVAALRLPRKADERLQVLMDRNTEGLLRPEEKEELQAWVELSESIALVRADALQVLGRNPT
jgi:hypothetical protein